MRCSSCKGEIPYEPSYGMTAPCVFCQGTQSPTAVDFLSFTELGLVKENRDAQIQLSSMIDEGIRDGGIVLVEAGTGVGKSFAYLLPAILSGKRCVISTAKKSLQSQLIEKDLPYLHAKTKRSFSYAPAYGKSNYACKREVRQTINKKSDVANWDAFFNNAPTWRWDEAEEAAKKGSSKGKKVLPVVYSSQFTAENCVGPSCNLYAECEYIKARKAMLEAKIVVTNHWLVGYHLRLQAEQNVQLLGEFDTVIFDEAHKLDEGIRTAFTYSISDNALAKTMAVFEREICEPSEAIIEEFPNKKTIETAWKGLFGKVKSLNGAVPYQIYQAEAEFAAREVAKVFEVLSDPQYIQRAVVPSKMSVSWEDRFRGMVRTEEKTAAAAEPAALVTTAEYGFLTQLDAAETGRFYTWLRTRKKLEELHTMLRRAAHLNTQVKPGARAASDYDNEVVYIENDKSGCSINIAPVDIASLVASRYREPSHTTVYVSATLAINGTLDIFKQRVGVQLADKPNLIEGMFGTAFNLDKQAILYLSKNVPQPTRDEGGVDAYRQKLADEIYDLVTANNGNAFVLFTARDEMEYVATDLKSRSSLSILEQETGKSAADLLKRYRATDDAVLLGLKSFWEGVDVAGDKLSLVIITKLPFPGRSDPIIAARRERAGDSWFAYVDIPDMTLDLRQGVGRLIRTATDRGVIAILDQRVLTKPYGKGVLRSLGLKQVTSNKEAVLRALGNLATHRSKQ